MTAFPLGLYTICRRDVETSGFTNAMTSWFALELVGGGGRVEATDGVELVSRTTVGWVVVLLRMTWLD